MAAAGVPADTPTITGTRPSTASTTAATTVRRSRPERLPASPIVPVATMPCTPASSSAVTLPSRAVVSTAPDASNGVVTAGMMPGKRTGDAFLVERHVLAHAADVLRRVELRRFGVAFGDRLVDHAVLGEVDGGPAGDGDRVVAQPLPQRLVHDRGDATGEVDEDGGARQRRDPLVEAAVAVVPDVAARVLHRGEQRLDLGIRPPALGGEAGDGRLEQRARLEQVGRAGVVQLAAALGGPGGDERARARPRLDHAGDLERGDRLAHRRAADLQPAREV